MFVYFDRWQELPTRRTQDRHELGTRGLSLWEIPVWKSKIFWSILLRNSVSVLCFRVVPILVISIEAAKIINKKQHKLFWRISDVCAHLVSCFSSQLRMTIQTNVWWSAKRNKNTLLYKHTVRNLHFLSQKFNFDFPRKLPIFGGWKTRENVVIFWLFSSWQLWFHGKNCQKKFGWKTRENVGGLSKLNFWTKIWLFE